MNRYCMNPGRLTVVVLLLAAFFLSPNLSFVRAQATGSPATAAEAEKFVLEAEKRLLDLSIKSSRADWINSNFITPDTEALAADAKKEYIAAATELAEASRR